MRDPNRIPKILKQIEKIWLKNSDLRLAQLLLNCPINYWMEDNIFIDLLNRTYKVKEDEKNGS